MTDGGNKKNSLGSSYSEDNNAASYIHVCSTHNDAHSPAGYLQGEMEKVLKQAKLRVHMDGPELADIDIWKTFCIYGKITDIRKLGHVAFIMFEKDTEKLDEAISDLNGSKVEGTYILVSMITNESIDDNAYKSGPGTTSYSKPVDVADVINVDEQVTDPCNEVLHPVEALDVNLNSTTDTMKNTVENDAESWSSGECNTTDSLKADHDARGNMITDSYFTKYVKAGVHRAVAADLDMLHMKGSLGPDMLDERAIDALISYPFPDAKKLLARFAENDLEYVQNKSAFLCSLMKVYNTAPRTFSQEDARNVIEKYSYLSSIESYSILSKDLIDTKGQLAEAKYTEYIGLGLDEKVADLLCNLYRSDALKSGDIQEETIKEISMYSTKDLSFMVGAFTTKDMSRIKDKDAYLLGMFKKWRCRKKSLNASITSSGESEVSQCKQKSLDSSAASLGRSGVDTKHRVSNKEGITEKSVIDKTDVSFLFAKAKGYKGGASKKSFKQINEELNAKQEKEMGKDNEGKSMSNRNMNDDHRGRNTEQKAENWDDDEDTWMGTENNLETNEGDDGNGDNLNIHNSPANHKINEGLLNSYVRLGLSQAVATRLSSLHDGKNLPSDKMLDDRAVQYIGKFPENKVLEILDRYSGYNHPDLDSIQNINAFFTAFLKSGLSPGMPVTATDDSYRFRSEESEKDTDGANMNDINNQGTHKTNEGLVNSYVTLGLSRAVAKCLSSLHNGKNLPSDKMLDEWSVSYLKKYPEDKVLEILDSYSRDCHPDMETTKSVLSVHAYFMAFVKGRVSSAATKISEVRNEEIEHDVGTVEKRCELFLKEGLDSAVVHEFYKLFMSEKLDPYDIDLSNVHYLQQFDVHGQLELIQDLGCKPRNSIRVISQYFNGMMRTKSRQGLSPKR